MMRARFHAAMMLAPMLLCACGRTEPSRPPAVRLNQDVCAECGMALSDARSPGALRIDKDGRPEFILFDDLGCMLDTERNDRPPAVLDRFVTDFARGGWIPAATAWFVRAQDFRTPMDSGIVAFADRADADYAAKKFACTVRSWPEIQADRKRWMDERYGKPAEPASTSGPP